MRFRSLLIVILALAALGGCTNQKPEPRKFGIGFNLGDYSSNSEFEGIESQQDSGINRDELFVNPYVSLKIQLDETLINNNVYTTYNIDWNLVEENDVAPKLTRTSYSGLARENLTTDGNLPDYEIKKSDTGIEAFADRYPEYATKISAALKPALSADYQIGVITFGRLWGAFFLPSGEHRLFSIGLGPNITYSEGWYEINLCDPYFLLATLNVSQYGKGECRNKTNLTTQRISNFGLGAHGQFILYSYIGKKYEINILGLERYYTYPIIEGQAPKHDPVIQFFNTRIASFVYSF